MGDLLRGYLGDCRSLSLAGMCKNAGKTTVLNRIIQEMGETGVRLGITSIGRDGESSDIVTGTYKPGIYVKSGTVLATAAGLLKNCDATREILKTTGIHTPLGEIILIRAVSDGFIDLAGPSMNQQLARVSEMFREYEVDKVLIDGAISRKSLCSRQVAEAVILCTGASYHKNMDVVVADTEFICGLLQLKKQENEKVISAVSSWQEEKEELEKYLLLTKEGDAKRPGPKGRLSDILREKSYKECTEIWVEGALTDALLKPLLMSNVSLKGKTFLVQDSSKLLLGRDVCEKLYRKGAVLAVKEEIRLLAVTVNPFSAYGNHFDKDRFLERMQAAVELPVINVLEVQND